LAPGESGWLLDIEISSKGTDLYSPLAVIEFQYAATFRTATPPPPRVIPDGYTVIKDGLESICFTNLGTGPAALLPDYSFSKFVALDDGGAPLFWHFLDQVEPIGLLQPGESGYARTVLHDPYRGTAHRMRAFVDFLWPEVVADASTSNGPRMVSAEETVSSAVERVEAWKLQLRQKWSLYRHSRGMHYATP